MPVTATHLTSGGGQNPAATSFATASISPSANKLVVVCVHSHDNAGGDPSTPTISGASMTWTQIVTKRGTSDNAHRITLFRALSASPGSGALTINFSTTQNEVLWSILEFSTINPGGTNGANAIVQSATNASSSTGTSGSVTLSAFSNSANATFGFIIVQQTSGQIIEGSGFTEINEYLSFDNIHTEYKQTNDTGVDWTWTNSSHWLAAALELKIKSGGNFLGLL